MPWRALALAALLLPAPARAQGTADGLLDLLARAPDGGPAHFADLAAARAALPPSPPDAVADLPAGAGPWLRVDLPGFQESLLAGLEGRWRALAGFDPSEVEAALVAGLPPDLLRLLRLSPDAAARIPATLAANGYAAAGAPGRFGRGAGDHALDLGALNPDDPFGGALGQASRVVVDGPLVAQGAAWAVVDATAEARPSADDQAVAAAIEALAPPGTSLVQATVAPGGPGLPWRLGILADLHVDRGDVTLALFEGPDPAALSQAALAFWADLGVEGTPLPVTTGAFGGLLVETAPWFASTGGAANPGFRAFQRAWTQGALGAAMGHR